MMIDGKTCMLAKAPKGDIPSTWVLEPKFDGHRILAQVRGGVVRMFARSGAEKSGHLPEVEARLALLPDCTIDGEVIAADSNWGRVQEIMGSSSRTATDLQYVVFDVLEAMGRDVRGETYTQRREVLDLLLQHIDAAHDDMFAPVSMSPALDYTPEAVQRMIDEGWEGGVVKNPNSKYESGRRSPNWAKVKATATEDVFVIGSTPGEGQFTGMIGALVFAQYRDGQVVEMGQCSGMTFAERVEFTRMRDEKTLDGLVIEVKHFGIMPTGGWRHPNFLRVRTDKAATDCVAQ